MTPEFALTIGHRALEVAATLMMIMLLPALLVGLLVSVFQAATQINEQTLSFIPQIAGYNDGSVGWWSIDVTTDNRFHSADL